MLFLIAVLILFLQNMLRVDHMPTQEQFATMKQDLAFKKGEMEKSVNTASALTGGLYFNRRFVLTEVFFLTGNLCFNGNFVF